ncbi:N-acetyltransferase GCN5 [Klebsiella pneumoniae]|nr:acyltransferase [Klebsiella pneumoniae]KMI30618.1 acyltransferase [Klebsiella pneumoniae]OUG59811.1 acyltransferase [Klebsiella pneumoniae]OUH59018.1 acyltransferase [Klebsiella pneumoniae]CAA0210498.1 Acetyltransferase [Klebsiella pneumoniae]
MTTSFSLRTLSRDDILHHLPALSELLASCVNGGASVSFMLPFAPQTAITFWQRTADSVAAGERIVLAAFDAEERPVGTVQLITSQPENQPHRADVAKLLVHQNVRRQGIAQALMSELERIARRERKTCWCWTRRPAAGRNSSMPAAAGKKWGKFRAMR